MTIITKKRLIAAGVLSALIAHVLPIPRVD